MPTQYLITYEEAACSEIRKERLRAETRAALGSAPLASGATPNLLLVNADAGASRIGPGPWRRGGVTRCAALGSSIGARSHVRQRARLRSVTAGAPAGPPRPREVRAMGRRPPPAGAAAG